MTSFLRPAIGGTMGISGRNGDIINSLGAANRGKPGQQWIPHPINIIETISNIGESFNNCDPQSQLQKTQQQIQQQIQQVVTQQINSNIQEEINRGNIQSDLQKLQELQERQAQGQDVNQQIEIAEKQVQNQMQNIIASAVARAATQMPNATKIANSASAGLKPVASVAESLANFVPTQGINMGNYASNTIKNVQTVSQACSV